MKKLSLLTLMTVAGIAGSTVLPVRAADVTVVPYEADHVKAYVIAGGQACSPEELKEILSGLCDRFPEIPEIDVPDNGTDAPGETQPDTGTSAPDTEALSYAQQVVALVNAERARAGLNALTLDTEIASAALVRAKETEISFSHTRPDGRHFSTALTDNGIRFRGAGENIAWGQLSPEEVMKGWMNSDGHRANILNPNYTRIGVGYYQNAAGRNYWTQLFTY